MAQILLGNVRGMQGRDGAQGEKGSTGARGTSFVVRGQWVKNTSYLNTDQVIDVVFYRGSAYYCKVSYYGETPPDQDATHWGVFCNGIERVVGRITLSAIDFSYSSVSRLYMATYSFPQGTFQNGVLCDMRVDQSARIQNGLQLGEVLNDNVKIYATSISGINNVVVEVYYENIVPTVVNNV